MNDNPRVRRLADRIQQIVARAVDEKIKDPRLGFVTITDVKVTGDSQHASVFYTVYGSDEERASTAAALKSATGMLRSEVGRSIGARLTPSLEFFEDTIPETSKTIDDLLVQARMRDAELAKEREGKEYAAGEDAYRVPGEHLIDDDEDDDDWDEEWDEDDEDLEDDRANEAHGPAR